MIFMCEVTGQKDEWSFMCEVMGHTIIQLGSIAMHGYSLLQTVRSYSAEQD